MENKSKRQLQQQSRVFTTKPFHQSKEIIHSSILWMKTYRKEKEENPEKFSAVWHNKRKFIEVMLCFVESPLIKV